MDWSCKALVTGVAVALLLMIAQRFGRHVAGLLAGLPTVTGPALIWLALDHGEAYAVVAAIGSVAACGLCAVFALVYERASRIAGPVAALLAASGATGVAGAALQAITHDLAAALVVAIGASLAIRAALAGDGGRVRGPAAFARGEPWLTAGVSAAVSGAVALLAPSVGPYWAGVLASPPLIAAAVAMREHARRDAHGVRAFLHGYVGGLVGRSGYGAVFALLVVSAGTPAASLAAALAGCAVTYATLRARALLPARSAVAAAAATPRKR